MRVNSKLRIGALLLCTLPIFQGCGGGGNDDEGEEPPAPATLKLTLAGLVTDGPIAGAAVTVTVGSRTFSATADANGFYEIPLEVPEDSGDDFVQATATGSAGQSEVKFSSLLGELDRLITQAGPDGRLVASENIRVNVTNLSTAEAALLEGNGDSPITSDAALNAALGTLNYVRLFDIAAAIKLFVDGDFDLPEGIVDTAAFAASPDAQRAFLNRTKAFDRSAFDAALESIALDPDLTGADSSSPPARAFALYGSTTGFDIFEPVEAYEFSPDGAGRLYGQTYDAATTWTIEGKKLIGTLDEPIVSDTGILIDSDGDGYEEASEAVHDVTHGFVLIPLGLRAAQVQTLITRSLPGEPELPPTEVRNIRTVTLVTPTDDASFFKPLTALNSQTIGAGALLEDAEGNLTLSADLYSFNAASDAGDAQLQQRTFTAQQAGNVLTLQFPSGLQAQYRKIEALDACASLMLTDYQTSSGEKRLGRTLSTCVQPGTHLQLDDVPGVYYQFAKGDEFYDQPLFDLGFRLIYRADGTGSQGSQYLYEGQVGDSVDDGSPSIEFRWVLDETGALVNTRYVDEYSETEPYNCEPLISDTCLPWDERTIHPLAEDGQRLYVLETRRNDYPLTTESPATTSLRYYDRATLPAAKTRTTAPITAVPGRDIGLMKAINLRE